MSGSVVTLGLPLTLMSTSPSALAKSLFKLLLGCVMVATVMLWLIFVSAASALVDKLRAHSSIIMIRMIGLERCRIGSAFESV